MIKNLHKQDFDTSKRYFATAAILIGVGMSALDSSIVNITLPSIVNALNIEVSSSIWIVNSYQIASAATMLICASLSSRVGEKLFFKLGMLLFTLSSLGCSLSSNFSILVAMRMVQGISYAIMISVGLGLYRTILPTNMLGTILGLNAMVFAVGTAIGPAIGGLIISYLSWPWLFYINIPLGIIAITLSFIFLGKDSEKEKGFDWLGAISSATALGLIVVAVDQIGHWNNKTLISCIFIAMILFIIFIKIQNHSKYPLLPLDIFRSKIYSLAVISSILIFISQGIALVSLPFVLQHTYGYSVLESAFIFTPWPVAVAFCAPLAGILSNHFNPTKISSIGAVLFCLGLSSLAFLPETVSTINILWRVAICGLGYGLFIPPNNREMFTNVKKNRTVIASGMLSTARTTGQSMGAAIVVVIIIALDGVGGVDFVRFVFYVFSFASLIAAFSSIVSISRIHR